jgi:hypothetical protein
MFRLRNELKGRHWWRAGLLLPMVMLMVFTFNGRPTDKPSNLEFRVQLTQEAAEGIGELGLAVPVTGRVFVIVSQEDRGEPRDQVDVTGVPFWGKDVHMFTPSSWVSLDDRDPAVIGYPLANIAELPPGDYYVQAFLNVYTTFNRADGHQVEMHLNSGAGQWLWEAPGNAYSEVQQIHLDSGRGGKIYLDISEVIQPSGSGDVLQQGNFEDTEWVKYIKIKSDPVSDFWGQDMYIAANILLPAGYDENPEMYYPVIYEQGHWPGSRAPLRFREREGNAMYDFWTSDEAPRFIAVSFRDANPYYDTSYSVDSANVGPYGEAIMTELIPYIEENFRIIHEPWARLLEGGSTGGWEALAMKVWNPDFFGGTWAWCPDAVDFHYHQLVNVYEHNNAYFTEYDWTKVERPSARRPDGNLRFTIKQENEWELAAGPDDRSGGQWDIWEAVYSPVGPDGYPMPVWDPVTGVLDHDVAQYWLENYDIVYKLQQNWASIGPLLDGQLAVTNGMMDTYYLNEATYLLKDFIDSADPPAEVIFDFGFREPHCWIGESPNNPGQEMSYVEFLQIAADWVEANKP